VKRRARASGVESVHAPLGDVLGFLQLLWAIDHALQLISKRLRSSVGITGPQRLVLRLIGHFERLSPGELSQVLRVDPSSLTGVLRRLERTGLVMRTRDPKDGRRAILTLTKRGRALHLRHAGTVESSVRRTLGAVSPAEIAAARDVLATLSSELEVEAGFASAKRQTVGPSRARPAQPRRRRSFPT
jgi:MarR family transcriptional regulator, organic hydroperoxide resistance regulator